jgi:hypothetical protein
MVGDMTQHNRGGTKFSHARECGSAEIVGGPMRNAKAILGAVDYSCDFY